MNTDDIELQNPQGPKEKETIDSMDDGLESSTLRLRKPQKQEEDTTQQSNRESFPGAILRYNGVEAPVQKLSLPSPKALATRDFWKRLLGYQDLFRLVVYRAAFIEFVGTTLVTFFSAAIVVASLNYDFKRPSIAIGLLHIPLLAFFIFATATASGGHLNSMITIATVFTGLTTFVRGVLYVIAQLVGAILGAALLKGIVGEEIANKTALGSCLIGNLAPGRALLSEVVFCFNLLFIAFGVALDANQRQIFGPVWAPFFISTTIGMSIFVSQGLVPGVGYTGAGINPSRYDFTFSIN
jgi:glycerol uptake facilitator-like aquaporin